MMNFHMYFKMNVMLYFFGVIVWILAFLCVIQLYYIQWRLQDFILGGVNIVNAIGFCCFQMTLLYVLYIL